jgi:hypothetical protein
MSAVLCAVLCCVLCCVLCTCRLIKFALKSTSRGQNVPEDDLVASGLAGLQLAAARFDPQMGTRFSTVATAWVGQHINRIGWVRAGVGLAAAVLCCAVTGGTRDWDCC